MTRQASMTEYPDPRNGAQTMNLATLEITSDEVAARLAEYEKMLADERTIEDDAILAAYRAAKRGLPIIRLTEAFRTAGRFPDHNGKEDAGLPRLAVVRADAPEVVVERANNDWVFYSGNDLPHWSNEKNKRALVNRRSVRVRGAAAGVTQYWAGGRTVTPSIPPRHRPGRNRLHLFHILWEVEKWTPEPPVDPALIRHIRGDLWSVMAVWDLTPIERAVLSQRSTTG